MREITELFSQRSLADFLLQRRDLALNELRDSGHAGSAEAFRAKFCLKLPILRTNQMDMVDSGVVPVDTTVPPGLDLEAEVAYLEKLIERIEGPPLIWAIVRVPFEGEAVVFELIPPDYDRPRPTGWVDGDAISLRTEHQSRDNGWKQQLKSSIVSVNEHLAALEESIQNFNRHIEGLLQAVS